MSLQDLFSVNEISAVYREILINITGSPLDLTER